METAVRTFRKIMDGTKYIVPPYQRAYSWGDALWGSLFNDYREIYQRAVTGTKAIHEDSSLTHFVGAAVMHEATGSNELLIIDGQQRLTTLNILAAAMVNSVKKVAANNRKLLESNEKLMQAVDSLTDITIDSSVSKLIVSKESSRKFSSRIMLGISDRKIYDELFTQIVTGEDGIDVRKEKEIFAIPDKKSSDRGKGSSQEKESISPHLRVEMALSFFYYNFLPIVEGIFENDTEEIARRLNLLSATLCDGFNLVVITTSKGNNPQDIFESLNARSKPLESFDLLKNYLLMKYTNGTSSVNDSAPYSLEEFYAEYLLDFDNPEVKESEELSGTPGDIEDSSDSQDISNSVDSTPFWLRDKATQADRGYATTVNNRTVFLNYWLDALYHPNMKSIESDKTPLTLTEQNTEHRYKNTDSIYKAYKKYFIAKKWNDNSYSNKVPSEVESFCIAMKDGGNFYREVIEFLEREDTTTPLKANDLDLAGFPTLSDLAEYGGFVDKERIRALLYFVEHIVIGLELRALWKQVLWLYRNRKSINNESFKQFIDVLESWAVRRFLFKKYPINNLNTATVNIMGSLLKYESDCEGDIDAGDALIKFLGKVASTSDYLYFPSDNDILNQSTNPRTSALNTVSCLIANSNLQKAKHLLIGINDSLSEDKDGGNTLPKDWSAVFAIKQKSKFDKEKGEEPNHLYSTIGNVILIPTTDVKAWNKLNIVDASQGSPFIPEKREIVQENDQPAVNGAWNTMIDSSGHGAIESHGVFLAGKMLTRWKDIERASEA